MIFDSDVVIWALRGNTKASLAIESDAYRAISIASCMELYAGARNRQELANIRKLLLEFDLIPLSEEIGNRGCLYMMEHALKIAMTPIDALIAATAVEARQALCTGNVKHFRQIPGLEIVAFRI